MTSGVDGSRLLRYQRRGKDGKERRSFACAGLDGAGAAILARDVREEGRYASVLGWDDMEAVRGWKGHSEFKERMSRVQQFVDKFAPTELEVVARLQGEG